MNDLAGFLRQHEQHVLWIDKPVPLDAVGALTAQAADRLLAERGAGRSGRAPVVFNRVEGYDIPVVDLLFANRAAQARVLGCEPQGVVPALSGLLGRGPKPLRIVDDAPCKARRYVGEQAD